jgi:hypothetical protein
MCSVSFLFSGAELQKMDSNDRVKEGPLTNTERVPHEKDNPKLLRFVGFSKVFSFLFFWNMNGSSVGHPILDQTSTSMNHVAFFIFLTRRFVGKTHAQYHIDSLSSNKRRVTLFKFSPFQSSTRLTKRVIGQQAILLSFIFSSFFVEMEIDVLLKRAR